MIEDAGREFVVGVQRALTETIVTGTEEPPEPRSRRLGPASISRIQEAHFDFDDVGLVQVFKRSNGVKSS